MRQHFSTIYIATTGVQLYPITMQVKSSLADSEIGDGLLTCFIRHTSASLLVQENADPDVLRDLADFLDRLVPQRPDLYRHTDEGPDDMPSHIRCMLTQSSLSVPVKDGRMILGTWQGLYLFEHRHAPHRREVAVHIMGNSKYPGVLRKNV